MILMIKNFAPPLSFLLVDKIVELEEDKRIVGIKNVTMNRFCRSF